MRTTACICAFFMALTVSSAALADVTVTAAVSPTVVSIGSEAVLIVRVEGQFRRTTDPVLPPLDDFYVYEGGTSQNFSYVNGRMTSSVEFRYTLQAKTEGKFEIGPVTLTIKNKQYTSQVLSLEVTKANSAIPVQPQNNSGVGKNQGGDEAESIFITSSTDNDTVYVNQQITWTLGYCSDGRISLLRSPNYSPPEAEGFWVEDLPPQNKYYTNIEGRRYLVNEIKRGYFPTSPGIYTIGAARVDLMLDDARSNRSLFEDFFNRRGFGKQHTLLTEEMRVVVIPLPATGRPTGFSGVVAGDLTVSLSADKQVAQVGEPINIRVEINGTGNMRTVIPPEFPEMQDYKTYESGSSSDTFKKDYVVTGRKIIDYVIIPQTEGSWKVPAVELSYFDPVKKRYRVARSLAVPMDIKPGAREEGRKVVYAGGGDDFEVINRDIRFIHPVPSVITTTTSRIYQNPVYVAAHFVPILLVIGSLLVERRRRRFQDDVGFARSSRALKDADRKIDAATKSFSEDKLEEGFFSLGSGFNDYFADKMNVPPAGLTLGDIVGFLESREVDEASLTVVKDVLGACDRARYAAGSIDAEGARATADQARALLRDIDRRILQ